MKAGAAIALVIIAILAIVLVGWYVRGLNRVVALHERVNESWAQVETMIQRRNDLIPNLVSTVRGYASHERELFEEITRLRSRWAMASTIEEKMENARALEGALARLMLVVENYPELKVSQNFQTLQAQLEGSENRIAVERRRYNEAARDFNTYIQEVFGRFFAKRRGLTKPAPYFEAPLEAQKVPAVQF